MLAGCVPVTFELQAAQLQWPLHWISRQSAMDCTVFVPRERAMSNMTAVFDELIALSRDLPAMTAKLRAIAQIAYRFQYSMPSSEPMVTDPSKNDALEVVLKHLLFTVET